MDKEHMAIERIRLASDMSFRFYEKPVLLCYSGGKDSDLLLQLTLAAGVPFEIQHSLTTADAPQTVNYVRKVFHELEIRGIKANINRGIYKGRTATMWSLIPQKLMPPTRIVRYCCSILKETAGKSRHIMTGVRWAESTARKGRGMYESIEQKKEDRVILNNDNADFRRLHERCALRAETVTNPIIDFSDADVFDFLEGIPLNPLYDMGFNRVGCIGCPMASKHRYRQFELFPVYKRLYLRAFERMLKEREARGKETLWKNAEDVFRWWMDEDWRQVTFEDLQGGER